jgi:hypothetical protein
VLFSECFKLLSFVFESLNFGYDDMDAVKRSMRGRCLLENTNSTPPVTRINYRDRAFIPWAGSYTEEMGRKADITLKVNVKELLFFPKQS